MRRPLRRVCVYVSVSNSHSWSCSDKVIISYLLSNNTNDLSIKKLTSLCWVDLCKPRYDAEAKAIVFHVVELDLSMYTPVCNYGLYLRGVLYRLEGF